MTSTGKRIRFLWNKFADKNYRASFLHSRIRSSIAAQIFFIRESRGWTQADLAEKASTKQPAISRMEKGQGALTIRSLQAVADAFDVGLEVRFVPLSHIIEDAVLGRIEENIPAFENDFPAKLATVPASASLPSARVSFSQSKNSARDTNRSSAPASLNRFEHRLAHAGI